MNIKIKNERLAGRRQFLSESRQRMESDTGSDKAEIENHRLLAGTQRISRGDDAWREDELHGR